MNASCEMLLIPVLSVRIPPELHPHGPLRPHERTSLQRVWRRRRSGKKKKKRRNAGCIAAFDVTCFNSVLFLFFAPQFFSPLVVSKIVLECGSNGRLNGEADVFFTCHQDALAALSRDREHIGEADNVGFSGRTRACRKDGKYPRLSQRTLD